jgi:hypothetical protein
VPVEDDLRAVLPAACFPFALYLALTESFV